MEELKASILRSLDDYGASVMAKATPGLAKAAPVQDSTVNVPSVVKDPVDCIAETQVKASSSLFITQQTLPASPEDYRKLREENAALLAQNKQLKAELYRKSEDWRRIKSILSQRKSIRDRLSPTKEDWTHREDEPTLTRNIAELYESESWEYVGVDDVKEPSRKTVETDAELKSGHQFGCPCCTKFYAAVGEGVKEDIPNHSKHKCRQTGPATPPGFWNVNFTQE